MAPAVVEEAVQSNEPANPSSGVFAPSTNEQHWTPETVLSTVSHRPELNSTSPLPFLHLIERLKTTKREGWRRFGIEHGESISDHMYRMSIMTLLCPPTLSARLDIGRCTQMALIHDMAESLVGDITPVDGVSKSEKSRREASTMDYLCTGLLGKVGGGMNGAHIRAVWQEYEDSRTPESQFVHDVDKMELLLQMLEYERSHQGRIDLGEFTHVAGRIVLPEVQSWAKELMAEREAFWASTGKTATNRQSGEEMRKLQDGYYGQSANAANDSTSGTNGGVAQ